MTTTAPPPPEAASASPSRRRPPASRRNEKRRRRPSTQARRTPSSWRRAARRARLRDPGRRSDGHGWRRARLPDVRRAPVRRAVREGRRRDGEDGARSSGNLRQPVLRRHRREHRAAGGLRDRRRGDRGNRDRRADRGSGRGRRPAEPARRHRDDHGRRELMARIAAVVLAAGEATRFGAPKQRPLLPSVLDRVTRAPVDEIVIVSGAYELEPPSGSEPQGALRARVVTCAEWGRGPGASLRCGLEALAADVEAAVVVLPDGPELSPPSVDRVLAAWR